MSIHFVIPVLQLVSGFKYALKCLSAMRNKAQKQWDHGPYSCVCEWTHARVFITMYEGWNFNSGNYLFTTDTK